MAEPHFAEIKGYLENLCEPQTLDEIKNKGVLSGSSVHTEATLEKVINEGSIVSKEILIGEQTVTLFWKKPSLEVNLEQSLTKLAKPLNVIHPPSRRSRMPFKSPARTPPLLTSLNSRRKPELQLDRTNNNEEDIELLASEIQRLELRLEEVDKEIGVLVTDLGECCEKELQIHIDKLHEYNEVKDVGQLLLGKIAEVEGTTTAALYERFGLELDN